VELAQERGIRGKVRLDERTGLLVRGRGGQQAMTREQASRVGVGHEDGPVRGIEKDRIRGLRTQPGDAEQLPPQRPQRSAPQAHEPSAEARHQPSTEELQPRGLQPIRSRRPDDLAEGGVVHRSHAVGAQQIVAAERRDGVRGVGPRGVLGQDRPHRDLVGSASRPPVLRTEASQEGHVKPEETRLDGIGRRSVRHSVAAA